MEITLSKKSITRVAVFLAILVALGVGAWAFSTGLTDKWFPAPTATAFVPDASQPAFAAVRDMFSPFSGTQAEYETTVCANMAEEGCSIFKGMYANSLYKATQNRFTAEAVVTFVSAIQDPSNPEAEDQLWRLDVITDQSRPVFIHVKQQDGQWFLARVLTDGEAKKYLKESQP